MSWIAAVGISRSWRNCWRARRHSEPIKRTLKKFFLFVFVFLLCSLQLSNICFYFFFTGWSGRTRRERIGTVLSANTFEFVKHHFTRKLNAKWEPLLVCRQAHQERRVIKDPKVAEGSKGKRASLANQDHVACRGTWEFQVYQGRRGQRWVWSLWFKVGLLWIKPWFILGQ